ncbi:multidrug transporter [Pectobacterium cacticida]
MKTSLKSLRLAAVSFSLLLTGCSLTPTYERPDMPVTQAWQQERSVGKQVSELAWDAFVLDDNLRGLIRTALENNRDLRHAMLNVEAARAQYRIQRADRLPSIDAQGTGTRQRMPADLSSIGQSQVQENYQASVGITAFELDLFGRVRSLSEAALQEYFSMEQTAQSARIALIFEVISSHLIWQDASKRLDLAVATLQTRETSLRLVHERRKVGAANELDYQEALTLVAQARAEAESMQRERRQAENALTLLVGTSALPAREQKRQTSSLLVQEIASGLPSDLLTRRPDILAAEYQLRARNADIGAARAAFFPRISLTGLLGSASSDLSNLFHDGQRTWLFTPQLNLPIFAGGRNIANLDLAKVRKESAVADYEKTIQIAFREVADALAATETLYREEQARQAFAEASAKALHLSEARWKAGVDDHLRYLDAQRVDFVNQLALIQVRTQRQIALATLFKALGGGWSYQTDTVRDSTSATHTL